MAEENQNTDLPEQNNDHVIEPEIVDVTETPQFKEYEAQQVAGSGLKPEDMQVAQESTMLEENPGLRFGGVAEEQKPQQEPVVAPAQPVATPEPVVTPEPVAAEDPVAQATETPAEPVKPEKIKHNKKSHIIGIMLGLLAILMFLSISFSVFLILPSGQEFIESFGYGANLAFILVMIIFGLFGVVSLVGALMGTFKLFTAKKEDKKAKKGGFLLAVASTLTLIISIFGFILGYVNLDSGSAARNLADLVITEPTELRNLTAPIEVSFDASAIPYDAENFEIISYQWVFGDGGRATGPQVTHTFNRKPDSGIYNVKLTITYRNLTTGEQIQQEIIKPVAIANQSALVDFTMTPDFGAAPITVTFDASDSEDLDGEIVAFEWDFDGDGVIDDEGEVVEFEYLENGSYDVSLTVTDTNGEVTTVSKALELLESGGFLLRYTVEPDEDPLRANIGYQFDASTATAPEGKITDYTWDFGDNTGEQKGIKVTHSYKVEGIYTLTLAVKTDDGKEQTKEFRVQVGDLDSSPQAVITSVPANVNGTITGIAPLKVSFSANDSVDPNDDIVDYAWDFDGDGIEDALGANAEFTYETPGEYLAVLKLTDAEGNSNAAEVTVFANKRGVNARVTADPVAGEAPLTVTFDASATTSDSDDDVVSFEWDFGDNSPVRRDNAQVNYVYKQVGTYTAKVTAVTASNKRSTANVIVNVNPVSLKSCFTISRKTGDAPLTIEFSSKCSRGVITGYKWAFGDGTESIDRQPVHTFEQPGTYEVSLTVEKDNVVDTFTDTVTVR